MISFEDIRKANESIRTTDIKGKDYAEVNQRIKAFRMVYPTGTIETELVSNENGVCVFKTTVGYFNELGFVVLATGTAYEREDSSFINKTSYIENCETSSVGRALGIAGFGIDTSVASAEEVQNAIKNQGEPTATPNQIEILKQYYTGDNLNKLLSANKVTRIEDITMAVASKIITKLKEMKK